METTVVNEVMIWNSADKRNIQNEATNKTNLYSYQNMQWYIENITMVPLLFVK